MIVLVVNNNYQEKVAAISGQTMQLAGKTTIQKGVIAASGKLGGHTLKTSTVVATTDQYVDYNAISKGQHHHHHHHQASYQSQFTGHLFKTLSKSECQFFEKLRTSINDEGTYDEIMKCFYCYVEGVFNQYELFELITPLFLNEDLLQ